MKEISREKLVSSIRQAFIDACTFVDAKTLNCLRVCEKKERNQLASSILSQIIENDELAAKEFVPLCQDTGIAVVFAEIGNEVHIPFDFEAAINEGVSKAYTEGYLRKSVVGHPLNRKNTGDNTPAVIHYSFVPGDQLKITVAPKGAGSENMSALKMLTPSAGEKGVREFVLDTVKSAGGRPCPPIIVGVGIGGNFEECALEAKKAVLRDIGDVSPDETIARLEKELLQEINSLDIGPMGLGGDTTCLAVKINARACHIASLPVAVNIQCHASRHIEIVL